MSDRYPNLQREIGARVESLGGSGTARRSSTYQDGAFGTTPCRTATRPRSRSSRGDIRIYFVSGDETSIRLRARPTPPRGVEDLRIGLHEASLRKVYNENATDAQTVATGVRFDFRRLIVSGNRDLNRLSAYQPRDGRGVMPLRNGEVSVSAIR